MGTLGTQGLQEFLVRQALRVSKGTHCLVYLGTLELLVRRERAEILVSQDFRVLLASVASLDQMDPKEIKDCLGSLDRVVNKDHQVLSVTLERRDLKA